MASEYCKHSYFLSNTYEGNVYSPEFWSNSYSNIYSSQTFLVILHGQIWSSLFGHVNNPQKDREKECECYTKYKQFNRHLTVKEARIIDNKLNRGIGDRVESCK